MGLAYYVKEDKEIGKLYYKALFKDATGYDMEIEDAIAYLDENRSVNSEKLRHVKDKEKTAKALAPLINTSYERVFEKRFE